MCVNKNVHGQILLNKLLELPACISFCLRLLYHDVVAVVVKEESNYKAVSIRDQKWPAFLILTRRTMNAVDGACLVILKPK